MTTKTKPAPSNPKPSGIKKIAVTIRGLPPGLIFQGKGLMEADERDGKRTKPRPPAEEAKLRAHWMRIGNKEQLCIPWVMIYQALCKASGSFKFRGRKTMLEVVPSTVACEESRISLGTSEFEVLEEYCRIPPRTGAMVKIGRPLIKTWEASFVMLVDDEMYSADGLREIMSHAGKLIGIGAWRPQLKGPHGRFEVVKFEIQ